MAYACHRCGKPADGRIRDRKGYFAFCSIECKNLTFPPR